MKNLLIPFLTFLLLSTTALAEDAKWNIKTNPLLLVLGATNGEVNYTPVDKVSVGLGGIHWKAEILDVEFTANEIHARADYWFEGSFKQGSYLGLEVSRLTMDLTTEVSGVEFSGDITSIGYLGHFGYHWQWENFNIDLGTYIGVYDFDSEIELKDSNGNIEKEKVPAFGAAGLEFFIGWAF